MGTSFGFSRSCDECISSFNIDGRFAFGNMAFTCHWSSCFFLFLSGYGLYCANQRGDKHRYNRIFKLLLTYIVLVFTIVTGKAIGSDRYPLSLSEIFYNFTGLFPSYIPEAWFLPPYILLALTAPWEFRILKKYRARYILTIAYILYLGTSFLLSRFGSTYIYSHRMFYILFCWFHFQFSFLIGMVMARSSMLSCAQNVKYYVFSKRQFPIVLVLIFLLVVWRQAV